MELRDKTFGENFEKTSERLRASFIPALSGRDACLPLTIEGLMENLKCVALVWEMQKVELPVKPTRTG